MEKLIFLLLFGIAANNKTTGPQLYSNLHYQLYTTNTDKMIATNLIASKGTSDICLLIMLE